MNPSEKKRRLTPAEVAAREERFRAAGLGPRVEKTWVVTTLRTTAPVEEAREDDDGSGAVE